MSDNKFILQLKGQQTPKSVVEIKNDKLVAPFINVPNSSDAVGSIIQDKDSSVVVAKGADVWKLDGGSLVPATNLSGNGSDYTGEYAVSGNMLWVNSTYTFSDTKIFTPNTKWVLQLCGKNLNAGNGDTIDFSFIVKIGSTHIMTKTVTVSEQANFFCKRFVLDFSESIQTAIKAEENANLTVQLLCADATASATIYNGMTTLVAQQRRVDGETVASDLHTFEDLEVEVANIADDLADHIADKNNPHEVTKAQVGLGNCDNTSDLDKPISTATQTALDGKVSTDGSSTMTGVLKMRATSSFQCAIAPFWDGVGFYKLNSDDSVTLIASIETPDGFVPWVTNTYNIGSSLKKWKNLYLAGKAYMSVINNGYDIAVPVTNSDDTLALKSEVDLAANSGRMITDQGVWYAKMYAATVAPSAEDGTNYADFSQVDGQGNPIIVIYERQNGAWVQDQTITPPAEYDGYVSITSKIWDITEQAGQQGGRILWNHQSKEFTPYPQIISFENAALTGVSTAPTPTSSSPNNQIATKGYVDSFSGANTDLSNLTPTGEAKFTAKANTDMDNLTSTGKNIANWSSNVSNCITNIPQDIKLELNGGLLTLKAGSKVYVPNGTDVFDIENITSDMTVSAYGTDATQFMVFVRPLAAANKWSFVKLNNQYSGPTEPASQIGTTFWYDTTNNFIKSRYNSGDWVRGGYSLPIAIVTSNGSSFTSINQVFNGFGYIGSTVFALPGVKGLIPDSRNADGSLRNIEIAINTVQTWYNNNYTFTDFQIGMNGGISVGLYTYDAQTNTTTESKCIVGNITGTSGRIDYITPKTVFRAVDYNEADFVVAFQRPTSANGYTWYRKYKSGWVEQGGIATISSDGLFTVTYPVPMATEKPQAIATPYNQTTSSDDNNYICMLVNIGTTTMQIRYFDSDGSAWRRGDICWRVEGMAAS